MFVVCDAPLAPWHVEIDVSHLSASLMTLSMNRELAVGDSHGTSQVDGVSLEVVDY